MAGSDSGCPLTISSAPGFEGVEGYLVYKERVCEFVKARNRRITGYAETH